MTPVCCMWQDLFSRFGEVVSTVVFDKGCNPDGRPVPKYGFVKFRKPEDCSKALKSRVSSAGWSSPPPFVCLLPLTEKRMLNLGVCANLYALFHFILVLGNWAVCMSICVWCPVPPLCHSTLNPSHINLPSSNPLHWSTLLIVTQLSTNLSHSHTN